MRSIENLKSAKIWYPGYRSATYGSNQNNGRVMMMTFICNLLLLLHLSHTRKENVYNIGYYSKFRIKLPFLNLNYMLPITPSEALTEMDQVFMSQAPIFNLY